MDRRLEPCTFGQGSNPLNNKFSILCTVMNSSRFMNSSEQYRFMNSDRYFGKYRKKSVKTRYIAEKTDKNPKFRRTDNRKGISCQDAPIHEISVKYRPIFTIFQTLPVPDCTQSLMDTISASCHWDSITLLNRDGVATKLPKVP